MRFIQANKTCTNNPIHTTYNFYAETGYLFWNLKYPNYNIVNEWFIEVTAYKFMHEK